MSILQAGQALPNLPGLYVDVIPPQTTFLSPAETDILGIVGTAVWGPVNAPTLVGGLADFATKFGLPQNRARDLGTPVWTANLQGAQNMRCVRVTDGTDVAATGALGIVGTPTLNAPGSGYAVNDVITLANGATIKVLTVSTGAVATFSQLTAPTSEVTGAVAQTSTTGVGTGASFNYTYVAGATLAAKYTGSLGNSITVSLAPGSQNGTWKATVFLSGVGTEVFDNIGSGLSGAALWTAIVSAINSGNALRGGSNIVVATLGASTAAPTTVTAPMSGGTDGATGVTDNTLLGTDVSPRTGMYALRGQGCSVAMLSQCTTWATVPAQVAFALSEGVEMVGVTPAGDTISNATTLKASTGIDSYGMKMLFGDWVYFNDTINGLIRLVSPQGFVAGWLAANGPQFSPLNKPLLGIVGTQKSASNTQYMVDELTTLNQAGFDVIANPSPGGFYFSCRLGHNSSSNPAIRGDSYTRLTNFIAATLNAGLGPFVGKLQSPTVQQQAGSTLKAFLQDLWTQGAIGSSDPTKVPYAVSIRNDPTQVAEGDMIADVAVTYLSVIERFVVNVQGGQTVVIASGKPQSA